MARTWIKTNNNQGNVLRTYAEELPEGNQTIRPRANINVMRVLDVNASMLLTIDGSKSLPGDELNVMIEATAAATISFDGDAAPGSVDVGAGGVGAVKLVNGGTEGAPLFVSYVPLS